MKTFLRITTIVILIIIAVGCAPKATPVPTEVPKSWQEINQLGQFFSLEQDWAAIEAAAKKEGKVVVYANSSRIEDQIAIWNKMYPDITLEGYDTEGIATKMEEEQKAGNVIGDVWFNSDIMSMFGTMYPKGYILPFIPSEFASVLPTSADQPFAISRYGGDVWGY